MMMMMNDIRAAIAGPKLDAEDAFRTIVGLPRGAAIDGGQWQELIECLDLLCERLSENGREMPPGTIQAIEGIRAERLDRTDYASGASAVREDLDRWRAHFGQPLMA